jgi:hypothetical protein
MLQSDCENNIRTRRKKQSSVITMTIMALLLLLSSIIVAVNQPQPAYAHGINFGNPEHIRGIEGRDAEPPNVAVSGRNVYALWHEVPVPPIVDPFLTSPDVFLSTSTNRGDDFGDRENLSNSLARDSNQEQIAVSGRNVYVVWQEFDTGIVFARSTDRGEDFDKETLRKVNDAENPQIAVSGRNVYVVWQEGPAGNEDVYFKRSTDGGEDFGPREKLSKIGKQSENPRIAVSGNSVYVAWEEGPMDTKEIYFTRSTDRGEDFDKEENLSETPNERSAFAPGEQPARGKIDATGRNVYVVWQEGPAGNEEIYFRASNDRGEDFDAKENLSETDNVSSTDPEIDATGRNVYVVWEEDSDDIFFRASNDRGEDFDAKENLSETPNVTSQFNAVNTPPQIHIAASGRNVYVVWQEEGPGMLEQIFFRASNDGGEDFDAKENISDSPVGGAEDPSMVASGGDAYVVWRDNRFMNPPEELGFEIFFNRGD